MRSRPVVVVAALLAVVPVLAGCSGGDARPPSRQRQQTTASPTPVPSPSSSSAPVAPRREVDLGTGKDLSTDLRAPWGLAFLPGGDALVAERDSGRVLQLPAAGGPGREVYKVPGVLARGEGGLLGLAVSPAYPTDRLVYAYLTTNTDNRIVRFKLGDAPEVVFSGLSRAGNHNGGRIAFGPDGMLYVGTGDANQRNSSQDPADPNGKILRLTPDGKPAPGNPSPGSPVFSLGHRNVQGIAWDAAGRLWAAEFGQNAFDEVNLIQPGRNYGWPVVEGTGDTQGGRFTNPVVTWRTAEASPSGMAIAGTTLYVAALRGQRLWAIPLNDGQVGKPVAHFTNRFGRLRTVEMALDGALWLTTSNTDRRGNPRNGDDRIIRFPPRG